MPSLSFSASLITRNFITCTNLHNSVAECYHVSSRKTFSSTLSVASTTIFHVNKHRNNPVHIHQGICDGRFSDTMSNRTKKATKKIERLRNRLIHIDAVPDMKVGWLTRYNAQFSCT
jgi:hypothetical protein